MVLLSKDNKHCRIFVNVCRWLLALVLMLAGFLKAVDPVGGMYKLQEYAVAFSLSGITDGQLLAVAVLQAAIEFLTGIFLLMGVYRAVVPFVAFLMMLLFTPFSLYVWVGGIVNDCGCFGESVAMSNGVTFAKNLLLLLFATVAFVGRSRFVGNLSRHTRWLFALLSIVYIFSLQFIAIKHLPLVDFGPYAVGGNLRSKVEYIPDEYEEMAICYKPGEEGEFFVPADSVMSGEWELKCYTEVLVTPGTEPEIGNFSILDWDSDIEFADELLADTGYVCIVVIEDVETASVTHIDKINDLYDYCVENSMRFCAASSSYGDEVLQWAKRTGAEYPVYWGDKAMLRSMLRANPGLLLLKDGMIVGKWAASDIPGIEELERNAALKPNADVSFYERMQDWQFWVVVLSGMLFLFLLVDSLCVGFCYIVRTKISRKRKMDSIESEMNLSDMN